MAAPWDIPAGYGRGKPGVRSQNQNTEPRGSDSAIPASLLLPVIATSVGIHAGRRARCSNRDPKTSPRKCAPSAHSPCIGSIDRSGNAPCGLCAGAGIHAVRCGPLPGPWALSYSKVRQSTLGSIVPSHTSSDEEPAPWVVTAAAGPLHILSAENVHASCSMNCGTAHGKTHLRRD